MLRMKERPVGEVMILDVQGTVSPDSVAEAAFDDNVRSVLRRGYRKILLNLAAMTSSDASGISALLGALHLTREAGAELRLLHVTRRLEDILIIVALHRYFVAYGSEAEALESFRPVADCARRTRPRSAKVPARVDIGRLRPVSSESEDFAGVVVHKRVFGID